MSEMSARDVAVISGFSYLGDANYCSQDGWIGATGSHTYTIQSGQIISAVKSGIARACMRVIKKLGSIEKTGESSVMPTNFNCGGAPLDDRELRVFAYCWDGRRRG